MGTVLLYIAERGLSLLSTKKIPGIPSSLIIDALSIIDKVGTSLANNSVVHSMEALHKLIAPGIPLSKCRFNYDSSTHIPGIFSLGTGVMCTFCAINPVPDMFLFFRQFAVVVYVLNVVVILKQINHLSE